MSKTVICPDCQKAFETSNPAQKTCSNKCRQSMYRRRIAKTRYTRYVNHWKVKKMKDDYLALANASVTSSEIPVKSPDCRDLKDAPPSAEHSKRQKGRKDVVTPAIADVTATSRRKRVSHA